ncbi:MAG: hypothetical protein RBS34_00375 [Desulfofustis sp.]|jgi:hypothetical protein|nr:hypothetical protein [Desulfofustis sp.]
MKITAQSEFHPTLSVTFSGLKAGANVRRLRGPRSRYCLDYSSNNTHVCGCGFPVSRTKWPVPEDWRVLNVWECGQNGEEYGRGYIRIELIQVDE